MCRSVCGSTVTIVTEGKRVRQSQPHTAALFLPSISNRMHWLNSLCNLPLPQSPSKRKFNFCSTTVGAAAASIAGSNRDATNSTSAGFIVCRRQRASPVRKCLIVKRRRTSQGRNLKKCRVRCRHALAPFLLLSLAGDNRRTCADSSASQYSEMRRDVLQTLNRSSKTHQQIDKSYGKLQK